MTVIVKFKAESRENIGKGASREARRQGLTPVTIYGKNSKQVFLNVPAKELFVEYSKGKFFSKLVEIETKEGKFTTLPQDIQLDPVKDTPLHVDFLNLENVSEIKVTVPIEFINSEKSPGIKRGGILNAVRRAVDIFCSPKSIPEKLIADLNGLKIGENIKYSNLVKPDDISPVIKDRDFTIATIAGRAAEEEAAVATAANPAAVPATTAKTPAAAAGAAAGKAPAAKPAGKK